MTAPADTRSPGEVWSAQFSECARDAVVVADATSGQIVRWNPAAEKLFGYSSGEALGLPVEALVPARLRARYRAGLARYRATGHSTILDADAVVELPALRKTGEELSVELSLSRLRDAGGDGRFVLAIVRDVTERSRLRAQADQRVREAERRRQVAEELRDLLAVVNSSRTLDQILEYVLEQAGRLLASDAGAVYLLSDEDGRAILRLRARRGRDAEQLASRISVGAPVAGLAVLKRRPVAIWDLLTALPEVVDPDVETLFEERPGYLRALRLGSSLDPDVGQADLERVRRLGQRYRAVLAVPLAAKGEPRGALTLLYRAPRAFTDESVGLASAFADQSALAVENARLRAEADERLRGLEALYRADETLYRSLRLDEVLQALADVAFDVLRADKTAVLTWDAAHERMVVAAARGLTPETVAQASFAPGQGNVGRVAVSGQLVVVEDALADPNVYHRIPSAEGIRSFAHVPIKVGGQVFGVFNVNYTHPRSFSNDDLRLLLALAQRAGLAIDNARLYEQSDQRTRELEALYRGDETLYRSLRLEDVLQALVDVATDILQADKASVMVWDARIERLVPGALRGFRPESIARMSHARGEGITGRVLVSGAPIVVEDALSDPRVAHRVTDPEGIRSLLHVPIWVNGEVFGVFGVNYCQQRSFSGEEERLLQALAQRAGLAIENARLFAKSEQQRRELEALYRADEALLRSLRLDNVLQALVEVVTELLNADKASVVVWDDKRERLVARAAQGYLPETIARLSFAPGEGIAGRVAQTGETILVEDLAADPRSSDRITAIISPEEVRSLICVPITVQGQVYGVFNVAYRQRRAFRKEDSRPFEALAQRAALAIENAHLYEQAQEGAIAEERQRLARELHDAVTQTLFSASLIAEVAPRLWERDPEQGRRRLEELRGLTRGALAEMRTLLLELRPAAFQEMKLPDLLRQLAESTSGRAGAVVTAATDGERPLPPEVQLALYRITQEALNNVSKYAGASHAQVHLRCAPEQVELRIEDDGRGFDPATVPAGHLGLRIMRERTEAIGATLSVDSRVGAGTRLTVVWQEPRPGGGSRA